MRVLADASSAAEVGQGSPVVVRADPGIGVTAPLADDAVSAMLQGPSPNAAGAGGNPWLLSRIDAADRAAQVTAWASDLAGSDVHVLRCAALLPGGAGAPQVTPSPGGAAQAGPVPGISVAGGGNPATAGIPPGGAGGFMPPENPQRKQQQDSDAERTSSLSARLSGELDLPERDDSRYGPRQPDGHR